MNTQRILVTGATGHVGRRVAQLLAERGRATRLLVRASAKRIPEIAGSEIAIGDYADTAALDRAFAGVTAALVVSVYGRPEERARLHRNAFEAAARAGVGHVVYLSFLGASPDSKFPYSVDHHASEEYLRASGVPHSILRDCLYMDVLSGFFGPDGVLRGPAGDGAVAWVAREDVARCAVALLDGPPGNGAVYDITGPEALTLGATAERLSQLAGRELRYVNETLEEARSWRSRLGAPAWEVDVWIGTYLAIEAGELAPVSDAVERLTGRPPYTLERYYSERPRLLDRLRGAPAGA
ncbi:MAG TPA: SDR family oxidoreductase [Burkholderiales bacterium]